MCTLSIFKKKGVTDPDQVMNLLMERSRIPRGLESFMPVVLPDVRLVPPDKWSKTLEIPPNPNAMATIYKISVLRPFVSSEGEPKSDEFNYLDVSPAKQLAALFASDVGADQTDLCQTIAWAAKLAAYVFNFELMEFGVNDDSCEIHYYAAMIDLADELASSRGSFNSLALYSAESFYFNMKTSNRFLTLVVANANDHKDELLTRWGTPS